MYKIRELDPVLNKEYRRIIRHQVKITFFSIEFGRKTTNIAYSICRTTRPLYRRKTYKYRRLYTGIGQKACFGQFFIAWISFKKTMCADTAGMHNTFWNSLMVKMGNFFPK